MESYKIQIKPSALKELESFPQKVVRQLVKRIHALTNNPKTHGAEKLSGDYRYRIRQGDYRVVYSINENSKIVDVVKIGHRKEIYR